MKDFREKLTITKENVPIIARVFNFYDNREKSKKVIRFEMLVDNKIEMVNEFEPSKESDGCVMNTINYFMKCFHEHDSTNKNINIYFKINSYVRLKYDFSNENENSKDVNVWELLKRTLKYFPN